MVSKYVLNKISKLKNGLENYDNWSGWVFNQSMVNNRQWSMVDNGQWQIMVNDRQWYTMVNSI